MSHSNQYSSSSPRGSDSAGRYLARSNINRDGGQYGALSYESGYSTGAGLERSSERDRYQMMSYGSESDFDVSSTHEAASYTADTNSAWARYGAEVRGAGLYIDSNPAIIRRETTVGVQTYKQTVQIRLLQPPAVPPPGPLIIKEVRAPQPPPLPPLRIKQYEPPAPALPPLIFRERPPEPPEPIPSKTVIKTLPALPLPPRSIIIERYPAPPPPPRDIIIERWLPYSPPGERKTIVERAEEVREYDEPRNTIIEYEPPKVHVVRQLVQLGVSAESPKTFIARYGEQLLDSDSLLRQVRAANVTEDISIPVTATSNLNSLVMSADPSYGADSDTGFVHVSSSYTSRNFKRSSNGESGNSVGSGIMIFSGKERSNDHHPSNYDRSHSFGDTADSHAVSTGRRNLDARV